MGNIPWLHLLKNEFVEMEDSFDSFFSRSYSEKCISFAGGIIPDEAYNKENIKEILTEMIQSEREEIYSYAPYQGIYPLRHNLAAFLRDKGITVQPGDIQILSETNQVLDYLIELLVKPGDVVITEEPISPDVYRELNLAGAKVIMVPMDEEGMIVDRIEPLIQKHAPKFIYVNSSFHDPTGIIMSIKRRHELLNLSYKYRVPIVEDDCASSIRFEDKLIPSLRALDKKNHVIYIYSFALTFAPGVRLAFAVAPKPIVKRLSYLVSMHLISIDILSQKLMSIYLEKGMYQKNLIEISALYKRKRDIMCELLEEARSLGVDFKKPRGGVYVWCRLPEQMDQKVLIQKAYRKGVAFIPGNLFFPNGTKGESFIRLNYSFPKEEQIREGMMLLIAAMRESLR
jgi:2-aminoadipate transaminase